MKPAPFTYHRPTSLAEALDLLAQAGDDAKPLAGGQSLIPLMAMRLARPSVLVDLDRVPELRGFETSDEGIKIGATVRQAELERAPSTPSLIRQAIRHIGHFQIRNRGTVGGSLAHGDPAAEWPALAVACDARLTIASSARGPRQVAAADFFLGPLMTVLEPDELLLHVEIADPAQPAAFAEVERRAGDFALVGAVAHGPRLVVFGAGSRPQRLPQAESAVKSGADDKELQAAAEAEIEAVGDIHAGAAYRRRIGARLVLEIARRAAA